MVRYFIFLGFKITAEGDSSHEIKRSLIPGRKAMTNLDSMLKSRYITLPTKVYVAKAVVLPVKVKSKLLSHVRLFFDPMDYTVLGLLQARVLEWVAIPFFRESSQPRD